MCEVITKNQTPEIKLYQDRVKGWFSHPHPCFVLRAFTAHVYNLFTFPLFLSSQMKKHVCEVIFMISFSLVEFIYGYVNLGRAVCVENASMDLLQIPLWLIVKSVVEMHIACFMILLTHMCSKTRCQLNWIFYMWIVSFLHTVWTFVGMYLFFAQCFSKQNIGDGVFVAFCIAMGLTFANLNFRIVFAIGNEDGDQHDYGRWNVEDYEDKV